MLRAGTDSSWDSAGPCVCRRCPPSTALCCEPSLAGPALPRLWFSPIPVTAILRRRGPLLLKWPRGFAPNDCECACTCACACMYVCVESVGAGDCWSKAHGNSGRCFTPHFPQENQPITKTDTLERKRGTSLQNRVSSQTGGVSLAGGKAHVTGSAASHRGESSHMQFRPSPF